MALAIQPLRGVMAGQPGDGRRAVALCDGTGLRGGDCCRRSWPGCLNCTCCDRGGFSTPAGWILVAMTTVTARGVSAAVGISTSAWRMVIASAPAVRFGLDYSHFSDQLITIHFQNNLVFIGSFWVPICFEL